MDLRDPRTRAGRKTYSDAFTPAAEHVQQGPRRPDRREDAGPNPATPQPGEHQLLTDESCGKCVPCREGLRQMHRLLTKICEGKGEPGDIEALEDLSETAEEASLCALGKSAPSPFRSTLKYFRHEYEAHVHEKRCPALACKELTSFYIDPELCKACLICGRKCPSEAIVGAKKQIHFIDQDKCNGCGTCLDVCPPKFNAVKKISGEPVPAPLPEEQRTC